MDITLLEPDGKEAAIQLTSLQTERVSLVVVRDGNHLSFSVYDLDKNRQYDFDLGEGRHSDLALEYLRINLLKKPPPTNNFRTLETPP